MLIKSKCHFNILYQFYIFYIIHFLNIFVNSVTEGTWGRCWDNSHVGIGYQCPQVADGQVEISYRIFLGLTTDVNDVCQWWQSFSWCYRVYPIFLSLPESLAKLRLPSAKTRLPLTKMQILSSKTWSTLWPTHRFQLAKTRLQWANAWLPLAIYHSFTIEFFS
jgi:hypothetical protein